ncbi:alpha-L-fucosidase [Mucilaginibacter sp. X5P1]|uniref:alpha-L-fucosidase n=1 Tax=Mucilaginibacter sp. X5P1 TaxID=2723088 RepID=UPI0016105982|nr:alpha-L-fucosidase [Mucilaginibacter sp. X5P1]MBB6140943.1 alpha-L-fucosidase [Mucilaginibacter sp. X5P1]
MSRTMSIKTRRILLFLTMLLSPAVYAQQANNYVIINKTDSEQDIITKAANVTPSPRQLRWQELEFTAFLHFGMNTFTNREWGDGKEDPKLFNPTHLDAAQWVRTCKEAGIKQIILTAKHHDGFCLWPSKYTEHSVKNSPWENGKGDVVKEVADACHQQGVGFGIYLSPWDRNNPDYGDTEKYNAYFLNQLTELLSNYGKVDEVWFDGANGEGPNGKKPVYHFNEWYTLIRKLQPGAVIAIMGPDVRWVGTETGYGRESEWSVVPANNLDQLTVTANSQHDITFKPQGDMTGNDLGSRDKIKNAKGLVWYPAEADVSIRPGWFYHDDQNDKVKSPEKLMDIYYNSAGKNCVLLLNVPPDKEGLINESDINALQGWKKLRDDTFKENLLKGATVKCANGINLKAILDNNYNTWFTTRGKDSSSVITLDLKAPKIFDLLLLQENISIGQRVEKFTLEYWNGKDWAKVTEGTTIGYKRLLRFPAITADKVRLRIESSRLNPAISTVGLYKQAGI